ncbi:MAG: histidine phosphatase family protein, partial [Dehalococcoidia bacterium]
YGWAPRFHLAADGILQAESTAAHLAATGAVAIFTSPLLRALQTTRILSVKLPAVPVRRMGLLIESGLAHHWEGTSWQALEEEYADVYRTWRDTPSKIDLGESMPAMARRMQAAMAKALRLTAGGPAICISHRDPILALRLAVEGRSFDALHTTPCNPASVTVLRSTDGRLTVERYVEPYRT